MHENEGFVLCVLDAITGYGKKQVLNGVSLQVGHGEVVALIGHNGSGKSTLLRAVFGILPLWNGRIRIRGAVSSRATPEGLVRAGVGYAPQGNRVFTELTVKENLEIATTALQKTERPHGIERACGLFPELRKHWRRRAGSLSGGEKQMVSLAGVFARAPCLVLLDEPSLGLAPAMLERVLERIRTASANDGTSFLIAEQRVREVLKVAQRVYVLQSGLVSYSGSSEELRDETKLRDVYL